MHYYQFNIGDYMKSTRHLTALEDIAYRRLLDLYYDTEKPLVDDIEKLSRLIVMSEYKKETQQILSEFFQLTQKGYVQKRVQRELSAYSAKADTARANGKLGGRPKKTQLVNSANPELTRLKAKQEPLTINQEPLTKDQKNTPSAPYADIIDSYHKILTELPRAKVLTDKRKRYIKELWKSKNEDGKTRGDMEWWDSYFTYCKSIKFLHGENERGWTANLEWIVKPENFVKIIEGNYK